MNSLEEYLDCQPINDKNIDNGKITGNILLNPNYDIHSCVNPDYKGYKATRFTESNYTHKELNSSTSVNGYAVLYAILIGLFITIIFVTVIVDKIEQTYRKIIAPIIFTITVAITYGVCLYFLTSNYRRQIVARDLDKTSPLENKFYS